MDDPNNEYDFKRKFILAGNILALCVGITMTGVGISWLNQPTMIVLGSSVIPCLMVILGLFVFALSAFGCFST
ncbi:hypothetical protein BGZ65_002986 [Modicella reniformis]|uniref:Uncharacterized protein n=1 Tax=Modicella reniformis TaxID=1440133 RepID=A0A9P6IMV9_9FUNG|nr:hypothetical protein BGZ65_002986 [Modicella reniformis]